MQRPAFAFFLVCSWLAPALGIAAPPRLDLNDVSWLFPPPQLKSDLDNAVAIESLKAGDGKSIWSDDQFEDILKIVKSDAAGVGDRRIDFVASIRSKLVWHVAAFRFDPSAPGCAKPIRDAFGSLPQIRLILQPITLDGEALTIHDVAIHLVYSFVAGADQQGRFLPDEAKRRDIIKDLDALKKLSEDGGAKTDGTPLSIHPGLAANVPGLRSALMHFFGKHLDSVHLSAMALMAIDPPEPWFFIAMAKAPGTGHFVAIPTLPTRMIQFGNDDLIVDPLPLNSNRNPISKLPPEPKARRGVATATLFGIMPADLNLPAVTGTSDGGTAVNDESLHNADVADFVANPTACHFFNTDCISCHTETRRRSRLSLPVGNSAYLKNGSVVGISNEVLPKDDWNVRNFGWFPPSPVIGGGPTVATATQRTANETAEVVDFIELNLRD